GAHAARVLPQEVPVDQVVVGELGVVGDVGQVIEHLLTRSRNRLRNGEGIHGGRILGRPAGRTPVPWTRTRASGNERLAARWRVRFAWRCGSPVGGRGTPGCAERGRRGSPEGRGRLRSGAGRPQPERDL